MVRTQISVDEELYKRAKRMAKAEGISLAELCRRALAEQVARYPSDKPWMRYVGCIEGNPDDSVSIDEVVYNRPTP